MIIIEILINLMWFIFGIIVGIVIGKEWQLRYFQSRINNGETI